MVKILYVHSSDELYGSDTVLFELVTHLDRERFQPVVVLPSDVPYAGMLSDRLQHAGIRCLHLRLGVLRRQYLNLRGALRYVANLLVSTTQLVRIIKQERIDLVHSNTSAVFGGALASAITRTWHLWHVHEIITQPAFVWKASARLMAWFANDVIAVSSAAGDHLCKAVPSLEAKTQVVHNGVDTNVFCPWRDAARVRREFGVDRGEVLIGMVGRVSAWKGQRHFLEAASLVARDCPRAKFALVGGTLPGQESRMNELRENVKTLGLASRVTISDWRRDIPDVWAACDIAVLPSIRPEPFGLSVLEAMATGRPVVATAHGGPLEIVLDGKTGMLVPPGDAGAMADALQCLIEDREMRKAMGDAGRGRVEEHFTVDRVVRDFEELYEHGVSQGNQPA